MRFIKMLGLAAISAIAAMAFLGASTASAELNTAICTVDKGTEEKPLVCPHANTLGALNPEGDHIEALAVKPELLSNLGNVTCDHSVILADALGLAKAPNPQESHILQKTDIKFTGDCLTGLGVECKVTTESAGLIDLLKLKNGTGSVLNLGATVRVNCSGVINCVFGGEVHGIALSATLDLSTSSLALIHINKKELKNISGILCPEKGFWDALYSIVLPHDVYLME